MAALIYAATTHAFSAPLLLIALLLVGALELTITSAAAFVGRCNTTGHVNESAWSDLQGMFTVHSNNATVVGEADVPGCAANIRCPLPMNQVRIWYYGPMLPVGITLKLYAEGQSIVDPTLPPYAWTPGSGSETSGAFSGSLNEVQSQTSDESSSRSDVASNETIGGTEVFHCNVSFKGAASIIATSPSPYVEAITKTLGLLTTDVNFTGVTDSVDPATGLPYAALNSTVETTVLVNTSAGWTAQLMETALMWDTLHLLRAIEVYNHTFHCQGVGVAPLSAGGTTREFELQQNGADGDGDGAARQKGPPAAPPPSPGGVSSSFTFQTYTSDSNLFLGTLPPSVRLEFAGWGNFGSRPEALIEIHWVCSADYGTLGGPLGFGGQPLLGGAGVNCSAVSPPGGTLLGINNGTGRILSDLDGAGPLALPTTEKCAWLIQCPVNSDLILNGTLNMPTSVNLWVARPWYSSPSQYQPILKYLHQSGTSNYTVGSHSANITWIPAGYNNVNHYLSKGQPSWPYAGFTLDYHCMLKKCTAPGISAHPINATSGVITTNINHGTSQASSSYGDEESCRWIVQCPYKSNFVIQSLKVQTESRYDYLTIKDLHKHTNLVHVSGDYSKGYQQYTTSQVEIIFQSDKDISGDGFTLNYFCTSVGDYGTCSSANRTNVTFQDRTSGTIVTDSDGAGYKTYYQRDEDCNWALKCPHSLPNMLLTATVKIKPGAEFQVTDTKNRTSYMKEGFSSKSSVYASISKTSHQFLEGVQSVDVSFTTSDSTKFSTYYGVTLKYSCTKDYCTAVSPASGNVLDWRGKSTYRTGQIKSDFDGWGSGTHYRAGESCEWIIDCGTGRQVQVYRFRYYFGSDTGLTLYAADGESSGTNGRELWRRKMYSYSTHSGSTYPYTLTGVSKARLRFESLSTMTGSYPYGFDFYFRCKDLRSTSPPGPYYTPKPNPQHQSPPSPYSSSSTNTFSLFGLGHGASVGVLLAIILGTILLLVFIVVVTIICCQRQQKNSREAQAMQIQRQQQQMAMYAAGPMPPQPGPPTSPGAVTHQGFTNPQLPRDMEMTNIAAGPTPPPPTNPAYGNHQDRSLGYLPAPGASPAATTPPQPIPPPVVTTPQQQQSSYGLSPPTYHGSPHHAVAATTPPNNSSFAGASAATPLSGVGSFGASPSFGGASPSSGAPLVNCAVCNNAPPSFAAFPCGHVVSCTTCVAISTKRPCAVCGTQPSRMQKKTQLINNTTLPTGLAPPSESTTGGSGAKGSAPLPDSTEFGAPPPGAFSAAASPPSVRTRRDIELVDDGDDFAAAGDVNIQLSRSEV